MKKTAIANMVIELYIPIFLADSIRNISDSTDEIRHESAKKSVIRKAMKYHENGLQPVTHPFDDISNLSHEER